MAFANALRLLQPLLLLAVVLRFAGSASARLVYQDELNMDDDDMFERYQEACPSYSSYAVSSQ